MGYLENGGHLLGEFYNVHIPRPGIDDSAIVVLAISGLLIRLQCQYTRQGDSPNRHEI
jgi:hypothetical protein